MEWPTYALLAAGVQLVLALAPEAWGLWAELHPGGPDHARDAGQPRAGCAEQVATAGAGLVKNVGRQS